MANGGVGVPAIRSLSQVPHASIASAQSISLAGCQGHPGAWRQLSGSWSHGRRRVDLGGSRGRSQADASTSATHARRRLRDASSARLPSASYVLCTIPQFVTHRLQLWVVLPMERDGPVTCLFWSIRQETWGTIKRRHHSGRKAPRPGAIRRQGRANGRGNSGGVQMEEPLHHSTLHHAHSVHINHVCARLARRSVSARVHGEQPPPHERQGDTRRS